MKVCQVETVFVDSLKASNLAPEKISALLLLRSLFSLPEIARYINLCIALAVAFVQGSMVVAMANIVQDCIEYVCCSVSFLTSESSARNF
jgi:hypothetical protein